MLNLPRIVITGVGLTSPNGNDLGEYRTNLLAKKSGVSHFKIRHMGETFAGVCDFEALRYQKRKEVRRGTRVGQISVYCANEAIRDGGLNLERYDSGRIGVYTGITEHGNVETENEVHELAQYDNDVRYWSHHHNPRTVANNPAGEITLNMGIKGPAYSLGGACAAGNLGLIHGAQMLQLGDIDVAIGGGVSESIRTFGIFASFQSQGALAQGGDPTKASRPFDMDRKGIVASEGGCLFLLERLDDAVARGARIHAELTGWGITSDATDFVLPNSEGQAACMRQALTKAGLSATDIDLVSTHATSTPSGDATEARAIRDVFADAQGTRFNNTKSYIGHAMGAAGSLELAGNLPSFTDGWIHPTINLDRLDPECAIEGLVANEPVEAKGVETILNTSFGMLGINSAVVVRAWHN